MLVKALFHQDVLRNISYKITVIRLFVIRLFIFKNGNFKWSTLRKHHANNTRFGIVELRNRVTKSSYVKSRHISIC